MTASHDLSQLLQSDRAGPCVTIYQPTHRSFPDNQQDPIRFRNLLKELENSFGDRARSEESLSILARLRDLADDGEFWNHAQDGLAVFAAPGFFRTFRLQRPVEQLAIVAKSFHVKPMLRIVQSAGRFQVLALNRRTVRLFEGDRDVLDEIALDDGVPRIIDEALSEDAAGRPSSADASKVAEPSGGAHERVNLRAGNKSGGVHRSHNDTKDTANLEVERFFRAVDRAVIEHHSKPSGLPLVLAALPEYHSPFRSLSHNRQLISNGIEINPEALSTDDLRARAWELILPEYEARLAVLVDRFGAAHGTGLAADRLDDVAKAAVGGRVDTLLLDASRKIPGRLDRQSGVVRRDDIENSMIDDALDDLAECVLQAGGNVVIVPTERMPSQTGLAAIYRY
jgi:hypothetical protein